jgi:hypothetical protein
VCSCVVVLTDADAPPLCHVLQLKGAASDWAGVLRWAASLQDNVVLVLDNAEQAVQVSGWPLGWGCSEAVLA